MPPVPTPTEVRQRTTTTGPPDADDSQVDHDDISPKESKKLVGIEGKWYDVTSFIPKHPGGPIIEQFIGKDATSIFNAVGHKDVLKYRKPVGSYTLEKHPCDEDFEKLVTFFKANGYYDTDFVFHAKKLAFALSLLGFTFFCVIGFDQWYMHMLGAVSLAFHWQQIGFLLHELMHTQVFRNRETDHRLGVIFGTTCFGMSAHWWQDEHIFHHGMTNTVDASVRFADPQMWESVWAQNEKMFPLFGSLLDYYLIKIQHITFIPVVMLCGRIEILTDSYRRERRWEEWVAIISHWIWMCYLLSHFSTWTEVFLFYGLASFVQGVFHFQLILSHYCRLFLTVSEFHKTSWYAMQTLSNLNIQTPKWQDWYYGGLNYHIEHHLFPTMARHRLRDAAPYVEEVCKKHNIEYGNVPFSEAMMMTLRHLKKTGDHYKLNSFY